MGTDSSWPHLREAIADPTGRRVEIVVTEVENVPLEERHAYVRERGEREGKMLVDDLEKNHHVSPLMGVDQTYSFRPGEPGERLQGARYQPHPGAEVAR